MHRVRFAGGAIIKPRKRSPKKDEKIQQALATRVGGRLKFHSATHEYMYNKLSGKGARHDSAKCRGMMHTIMSKYHPSLFNSYMQGHVVDLPRFENDHLQRTAAPTRRDARVDVLEHGGSLHPISHSVDGFLTVHDSEFHHRVQIV